MKNKFRVGLFVEKDIFHELMKLPTMISSMDVEEGVKNDISRKYQNVAFGFLSDHILSETDMKLLNQYKIMYTNDQLKEMAINFFLDYVNEGKAKKINIDTAEEYEKIINLILTTSAAGEKVEDIYWINLAKSLYDGLVFNDSGGYIEVKDNNVKIEGERFIKSVSVSLDSDEGSIQLKDGNTTNVADVDKIDIDGIYNKCKEKIKNDFLDKYGEINNKNKNELKTYVKSNMNPLKLDAIKVGFNELVIFDEGEESVIEKLEESSFKITNNMLTENILFALYDYTLIIVECEII